CGAGPLAMSRPTIDSNEFLVVGELPQALAPGASATVEVAFSPLVAGPRMGTLQITTSAAPGSPETLAVDLFGNGMGVDPVQSAPGSLYACDCASTDPGNASVILLALAVPLVPWRRR